MKNDENMEDLLQFIAKNCLYIKMNDGNIYTIDGDIDNLRAVMEQMILDEAGEGEL